MEVKKIKINLDNLEKYYNDWDGNLYYLDEDGKLQIVDGFSIDEIRHAIKQGVEFFFIWGGQYQM